MPLARWRCSFGGGWACPPPMPPCPRYARAQARGLFNYSCGGWFAPFRRGADLRGVLRAGTPAPRLCGSGGPRPFSPSPLPTVAPRQGRRGFGRAVLATLAGFFSATALGVAAAAGCAERAPASASSGVRPKPRPPAAASAASAPLVRLACATRPASVRWARPRRRRHPHRVRVARYEMSWVSQKNRLRYGIPAPDLRGTRFFWEPSLRHSTSRLKLLLLLTAFVIRQKLGKNEPVRRERFSLGGHSLPCPPMTPSASVFHSCVGLRP